MSETWEQRHPQETAPDQDIDPVEWHDDQRDDKSDRHQWSQSERNGPQDGMVGGRRLVR